jgi:hypothetical protein
VKKNSTIGCRVNSNNTQKDFAIFRKRRNGMARENYRIKTACPQCGCTELTVLSAREIKEKYGDVPNFDMECGECMEKYAAEMKSACPEWDQDCKLQE